MAGGGRDFPFQSKRNSWVLFNTEIAKRIPLKLTLFLYIFFTLVILSFIYISASRSVRFGSVNSVRPFQHPQGGELMVWYGMV